MSPVPQINDLQQIPSDFLPFDAALAARAPRAPRSSIAGFSTTHMQAEELGVGALLRFKSMMALEGQTVHLARLCYDKLYAYERIAAAHTPERVEAIRHLQAFLRDYRSAWLAWRSGKRAAIFPAGTYALRVYARVACAPACPA